MEIVLLGHIIGDFYFQPNCLAKLKNQKFKFLLLHSLIYAITIYASISIATKGCGMYIPAILVLVCHLVIDKVKAIIENRSNFTCKYGTCIFVADQALHILVLYVILQIWSIEYSSKYVLVIICLLICWKPAAVFITKIFEACITAGDENIENNENGIINAGYWIGVLERIIIFILGCFGEYAAIGFVLAAKSLARHNDFSKTGFAEKYLIGTLLSSLIAFVCIVICKM